jgi:uncharacterized protein involved in tolerance to divalent cations
MKATGMLLVLTTLPDDDTAQRIANDLVDAGLAACVSIGAPVRSVYRWQGAVEQAAEVPLRSRRRATVTTHSSRRCVRLTRMNCPKSLHCRSNAASKAI